MILFSWCIQHVQSPSGDVTLASAYIRHLTVMAMHTVEMAVMNQPCVVSACTRFTIPRSVTIFHCRVENNVCSYITNMDNHKCTEKLILVNLSFFNANGYLFTVNTMTQLVRERSLLSSS